MIMEPPEPTSAGNVEWSARTNFPPSPVVTPSSGALALRQGVSNAKTKSSLLRRLSRSTAVRARTSDSKTD